MTELKSISNNKDQLRSRSCVICEKKFYNHSELLEHFKLHGKNKIDLAGNPRLELISLLESVINDTSQIVQIVQCEFCDEKFLSISKAIFHRHRKHRNEAKNYSCEHCGKLFPLKFALDQHVETEHNSELTVKHPCKVGEIKCSKCPEKFTNQTALDFHQKHAHDFGSNLLCPMFIPGRSKKIKNGSTYEVFSVYYCHLCGSEYLKKENLKKHLFSEHSEEERITPKKLIQCQKCEAVFYSKNAFHVHSTYHDPDDLYVTDEEQRKRILTRVDLDFDSRRVPTMKSVKTSTTVHGMKSPKQGND